MYLTERGDSTVLIKSALTARSWRLRVARFRDRLVV